MLEKAAAAVEAAATFYGFVAVVEPCDVSQPAEARRLAAAIEAPDVLVNNAGAGAWKHVEETTREEAVAMMAVPYQAAFSLTALLTPQMAAKNGGGHGAFVCVCVRARARARVCVCVRASARVCVGVCLCGVRVCLC